MKTTLGERIKEMRKFRRLSQVELAERVGITQGSLSHLEGGRSETSKELPKIAKELGVDINWLLYGEEQDKPNMKDEPLFPFAYDGVEAWDDNTPLGDDEAEIIFFKDFHLSAGHGSFDEAVKENEKRRLRISKRTLQHRGVLESQCYAFTVDGDSMSPEIKDGSTVWVDTGRKNIKDGKIYAINHGGAFKVKRLYNLPLGGVRIVSENEDKDLYPTEELTAEQIQEQRFEVIGWVWHAAWMDRW